VTIATDICIPTIAFIAEEMNLISNSYHSSILSTNKSKMRKSFEKFGVSSPKSKLVSTHENLSIDGMIFPLIVKPTDRSGSRGVTKVDTMGQLKQALERAIIESIEKKAVVEEYIEGVEVSVESISWKSNHTILAITDKITTESPYFVELEHHQPSVLSKEIQERLKNETIKALNSLQIEYGASHSEFKINKDGKIFIIEVGARMGGDFIGSHLVELSTGYDFVKGVIEIAMGSYNSIQVLAKNCSGVYFLSKETAWLNSFFEKNNSFEIEKKILNSTLKNCTSSSDRSGYLIYQSKDKIVLN
jgi:biotin carboxylase